MSARPSQAEIDDIIQAHGAMFSPSWLSSTATFLFYGILLVAYQRTAAVLGIHSGEFLWVVASVVLLFVSLCCCNILLGMRLGPAMFDFCTGLNYRENRMSYARAGGYDADQWTALFSQILVMSAFWWTSGLEVDPIPFLRSVWGYTIATVIAAISLHVPIAYFLFRRHAQRAGHNVHQSKSSIKLLGCHILGTVLLGLGRKEAAIAAFNKALRFDAEYRPSRHRLATLYYNDGLHMAKAGHFEEAVSLNRLSIQFDRTYALAHNNLGVCLYALRHFDEAVAAYREALELDPNGAPAHNNLGEVLVDLGKYQEAIVACRQAIRLEPQLAEPNYQIGRAFAQLGRWPDVVREWEEARERIHNVKLHGGACQKLDDSWKEREYEIQFPAKRRRHWRG